MKWRTKELSKVNNANDRVWICLLKDKEPERLVVVEFNEIPLDLSPPKVFLKNSSGRVGSKGARKARLVR
jgi:hypothetical protein